MDQHVDLISDFIRTGGLLCKVTFDKNIGIDPIYVKQFFPLLPTLMKLGIHVNDIPHQTLLINIIKTIGILANQASINPVRSQSFYREIVEVKFIPDSINLFKNMENANTLHKYIV